MLKSNIKLDDLIKSSIFRFDVIPAKTEIQQTIPTLAKAEIDIHGSTVQKKCIKIRRLLMVIAYDDEEGKPKTVSKKVYIIINDEKHYIDPDIVKKYNLENAQECFFTGRKLYVEKD